MQEKLSGTRAVAFDLDGTLIDTLPDLTAAVNEMLKALEGGPLTQARVRQLVGDGADQLVARALTESFAGAPATEAERAAAQKLFYSAYAERLFDRSRLYPDTVATLRALTAAAYLLCCVTNKSSRFALPLLELAGLKDFFAFTLCADAREDRKPSPTLLLAACRRLGVAPREMLYVGDAHTDVVAAHAAGCRAVAVTFGYNRDGSLQTVAPEAIIASLADVTQLLPARAPG
jgi:phosphoglycolate phosphatase